MPSSIQQLHHTRSGTTAIARKPGKSRAAFAANRQCDEDTERCYGQRTDIELVESD